MVAPAELPRGQTPRDAFSDAEEGAEEDADVPHRVAEDGEELKRILRERRSGGDFLHTGLSTHARLAAEDIETRTLSSVDYALTASGSSEWPKVVHVLSLQNLPSSKTPST